MEALLILGILGVIYFILIAKQNTTVEQRIKAARRRNERRTRNNRN
jgi:hypothetical protein